MHVRGVCSAFLNVPDIQKTLRTGITRHGALQPAVIVFVDRVGCSSALNDARQPSLMLLPMPLDPALALLLVKMLTTAGIVVLASLIAERTGPLVAAMVATLPVSAGPIYAFLAMEHEDPFIAGAVLASASANLATAAYSVAYVLAAQHMRTLPALGAAFGGWAVTLMSFAYMSPPFWVMLALTLLVFPLAHRRLSAHLNAPVPAKAERPWFAIPLRAAGVATLVAFVTSISAWAGSQWTGLFATFPVVLTSLIVILHPRIGGRATAAMIASGILGLMGFGLALLLAHALAVSLGRWSALGLALAWCVLWNLALLAWSRRA